MVKVLVVDDSALMRRQLSNLLTNAGGFEVHSVRTGAEALEALETFDPDVISLDINMPEMDGITCLANIMAKRPKPVVMVSSLTEAGAEATFQSLSLGAVDFVHKPGGTISISLHRIERELVEKIRAASTVRIRTSRGLRGRLRNEAAKVARKATTSTKRVSDAQLRPGVVVIGVSTGGPGTLEQILPALPEDFPWPVLIAQHMPGGFTAQFARRLDEICRVTVKEVDQPVEIAPGTVYIARGDADTVLSRRGQRLVAIPAPSSAEHLWHPSVERLVTSASAALPADRLIAVQLTGMGDDGAKAMADLHRRGALTIAQDEATSIVFGMPNELIKLGGATCVLPTHRIAAQLCSWLGCHAAATEVHPQAARKAG